MFPFSLRDLYVLNGVIYLVEFIKMRFTDYVRLLATGLIESVRVHTW